MKDLSFATKLVSIGLVVKKWQWFKDNLSLSKMRKKVDVRTEKNCAKGLATGLGRIPGEALRIVTLANGSSYCCGGTSYKVSKVTHGWICYYFVNKWTLTPGERRLLT